MRLFNFLRKNETKASRTGAVIFTDTADVVWSPRDYASFAKEGYQQNVIAFQSVNKIAESVASVSWEAWRGDKQLLEHEYLTLINKPSPLSSRGQFIREHISYKLIAGNGYIERILYRQKPRELYALRPDRMSISQGKSGFPSKFSYKVGPKVTDWPVDSKTGVSDIWQSKSFNPLNDWYGQAPAEAGAFAIDQHNQAMTWMQALLQNSARPSGAVIMKDGQTLTPESFNRLKGEIEQNYAGSKNAGRPMLLDGGLDWKQMGLSPRDMGVEGTKDSAARDIALAYGVPPLLLSITGDSTYSNYSEARLAFWEDTVIPEVNSFAEELNTWLSPLFDGVELRPNLDEIPAIVDKRSALWGMADQSEDLTIDERRKLKGYEPLPNGAGNVLISPSDPQNDDDGIKSMTPEFKAAFAYGVGPDE